MKLLAKIPKDAEATVVLVGKQRIASGFSFLFYFIFKAKDYVKSSQHRVPITLYCDLAGLSDSILSRLILVMKIIKLLCSDSSKERAREKEACFYILWKQEDLIILTLWGHLAHPHIENGLKTTKGFIFKKKFRLLRFGLGLVVVISWICRISSGRFWICVCVHLSRLCGVSGAACDGICAPEWSGPPGIGSGGSSSCALYFCATGSIAE